MFYTCRERGFGIADRARAVPLVQPRQNTFRHYLGYVPPTCSRAVKAMMSHELCIRWNTRMSDRNVVVHTNGVVIDCKLSSACL
jgi:hypothetical protein